MNHRQHQLTRRVSLPRSAAPTADGSGFAREDRVSDLQEVLRSAVAARTSATAHERENLRVHIRRLSDELHTKGQLEESLGERAQGCC